MTPLSNFFLFGLLAVVLFVSSKLKYEVGVSAKEASAEKDEAEPVVSKDDAKEEEAVVVLTDATFDKTLKENDVVLVKFYAPWCGHCKRMAPEYEKAAQTLKKKGSKVVFAKVDATAETEIADKQTVREYPTVTLFRKQQPEKYVGDRTASAILEWIEMMTGPALTEVQSTEGHVSKTAPIAFVAEFKSENSPMKAMMESVADKARQLGKFLVKYGGDEDKMYAVRHEEGMVEFTGKTEDDLKSFVETESFPLLGPINGENFRKYLDRQMDLAWLCGTEKDFDDVKTAVREAAKKLRGKFSFVWLDTDQFKGHAENALGVTEFPALVLQTKQARYVLPDAANALKKSSEINKFADDVEAGKIERSLKSEPIPESQDEAIKVVVGKNFEEMVLRKDKDVFLEIYAPWCGYCKSFEPIYKEFAEKHGSGDRLIVAKMDGTANETPLEDFNWSSFPTIFFIKAGEKTPIKFEGSRTVEGLLEFANKHGTTPVTKPDRGEEL